MHKLEIVEAIRCAENAEQAIKILDNATYLKRWDEDLYPSEDNDDGSETVQLYGACCCKMTAGTNGFHGGDGGHGCSSFIEIEDDGGLGWAAFVQPTSKDCALVQHQPNKVRLEFYGDEELNALIKSLELAATILREQALVKNTNPFKFKALKRDVDCCNP